MPGLAVNDIVEIRFRAILFDQLCLNVLHYKCTTAGVGSVSVVDDLDKLLNQLDVLGTSVYFRWKACLGTNILIQVMEAQLIQPTRSAKRTLVPSNVVPGRTASSTANVSAVITKATDFGGRGQVGSIHLPSVADLDIAGGELVAGLLTLMGTLGSSMLDNITAPATGVTVSPILYHPPVKADPAHVPPIPAKPYSSTSLTRTLPQTTVRVMRRRTVGVGR